MRVNGIRVKTGRLPLLPLFLAGFFLGILGMAMGRQFFLQEQGLLDEASLYQMKYMTVNNRELFWYVLARRLRLAGLLCIMATTYLGLVIISGMAVWSGMTAGLFLSAAVLRYGVKGVLLAVTGIFPQYILFVPAAVMLMVWGEKLCRGLYFKGGGVRETLSGQKLYRKLLSLLIILTVVITGCFLESYVNPFFLSGLLKIF